MKKVIVLSIILGVVYSALGQFECGYESPSPLRLFGDEHIANGGVFTPKGNLRILVVFISYGEPYDSQYVEGWPVDSELPLWATSSNQKVFYNDYSEFPSFADRFSDTNRQSISNFYYQMSNGTFKVIADYYPERVIVDNPASLTSWKKIHEDALNQISFNVHWDLYDNRKNRPDFRHDYSTTYHDNKIDYIVFCHRYCDSWQHKPFTGLSHQSSNGFTGTELSNCSVGNGYYVTTDGFTFVTGDKTPLAIFVHEIGHKLYNGPHYAGNNNVCGDYFYEPSAGWGCMRTEQVYCCAAGWERYILDWTQHITANNINSNIMTASDLSANNGIFILHDFITTGDAIRIKIPPYTTNYQQYLWLENHQGISTFDGNYRYTQFCGTPTDEFHNGIVAYVERYSNVKDNYYKFIDTVNGVRWLSKDGNYDFSFKDSVFYPAELCNEEATYPFHKIAPNPIGGQSINEYIRHDFNNDGIINHNPQPNSTSDNRNEQSAVIKVDDMPTTAKYITGTGLTFQKGDKVGIARNPCVKNLPRYDSVNYLMKNYYLNGISFEILDKLPDSSMVVKIRLDDVEIDRPVRWAAASIVLTDITGDSRPDVDVLSSITVDIDKSGTPNRHRNPANPNQTSSTTDDFITPTTFTCRNNSYFKQEANSRVNVKNSSTLVLESGSMYEVGDGAVLNIEPTATLHIKSGATLKVNGSGHVEIQDGAYICIEDGANIELVDFLSSLNLRPGHIAGAPSQQSDCTSTPLSSYTLVSGSAGSIRTFSGTRFIQNKTYLGDAYEAWNDIIAGYQVVSGQRAGNVVMENGSHVILDGVGEVRLEPGVIVKQGAILEVR